MWTRPSQSRLIILQYPPLPQRTYIRLANELRYATAITHVWRSPITASVLHERDTSGLVSPCCKIVITLPSTRKYRPDGTVQGCLGIKVESSHNGVRQAPQGVARFPYATAIQQGIGIFPRCLIHFLEYTLSQSLASLRLRCQRT